MKHFSFYGPLSVRFMGLGLLGAVAPAFGSAAYAQTSNFDTSDEIIVTGTPLSLSEDEVFTGVSILTGDELSDRLANSIGETLKAEPGLSSTFFGAGASRPIIRGQGGDRIRVLLNGIGSIDASAASPDHAVAAEPAQAEQIEVLRGAGLLRYGSSGAGGVVNVIDGRIPQSVPEDGIDGAVRIGASSVDSGRDAAGSVDIALTNNIVLHLDGTFREADDYRIPEIEEEEHDDEEEEEEEHEEEAPTDRLENSAVDTSSFTAGLSFVGDWGFIGGAIHEFRSDYGVPGEGHGHGEEEEEHDEEEEDHDEEEEEEEEMVTIDLEQTRFDLNGAINLGGFFEKLQFFGGYADYEHTEFEAPGEAGTVFANEGYEGRVELIQSKNAGWEAAYGVHYRDRDFSAIGEEAFVPPTQTTQIAAYMFHRFDYGQGHIEGSARYENTSQDNEPLNISRDFDTISLSAGADYHVTEAVRAAGTVFRTERAPATEELFANGPHLATSQFEIGDINLDKEVATGAEVSLRYRAGGSYFTANIFYTDYSDYIFERETGEEEDELPVFQFTAADATFRGFEVQGGLDLFEAGDFIVKGDGLVEYVRAKTDTDNLPRIPPLSFLGGIEAESERLSFRAELEYVDEQNKVAQFEEETSGYEAVNLSASWKAPVGAQPVRLSVSVNNLFNVEARQHSSFLNESVPLPGRNIRFSIRSEF